MIASVRNLGKAYGKSAALDDVSFELRAGEILGLMGLNGAGKTTAIKILCGLAFPDRGSVEVAARRIGFLPEETALFPDFTPRELIRHAGLDPKNSDELLEKTGIANAADRRSRSLSKGTARRVGLALALAADSDLLVLDEPQSGLDPLGRRDLGVLVRAAKARGCATLFASHDLSEVAELCDRVIVLHKGRIRKIVESGEELRATFFSLIAE